VFVAAAGILELGKLGGFALIKEFYQRNAAAHHVTAADVATAVSLPAMRRFPRHRARAHLDLRRLNRRRDITNRHLASTNCFRQPFPDCQGAVFFKAAAKLGLEGIVSKRAASRYRSGPSHSWLRRRDGQLQTKNMVESDFILLGTERDSDGVPWALLASDRDGRLEFAGAAILNPP